MRRLFLSGGLLIFAIAGTDAAVTMTISIHKVSDNTVESQIHWPAIALPAGWVVANDYIQLDTQMTNLADGIQIYTDNTAADADPRYTAPLGFTQPTPAGLVNPSGTQKLPTAWMISDLLSTPAAVDPNAGGFTWLFHEDRAQVANNQGASDFANGDSYITLVNQNCPGVNSTTPCIHWGPRFVDYGAAASPNYIYLQADFHNALAGTYKTSTLRIEAFSQ